MKKSNWITYIVTVIVSAFLLWLWYWLGFDHVDAPLDLALSIIWWVMVAVACFAISRIEMKRRERRRTCFVASNHVFNAESGTASAVGPDEAVERIHDILRDMKYDMDIADMPEDGEGNKVRYDCVVRTRKFEVKKREAKDPNAPEDLHWEGEVAVCARPDDDPLPFANREELTFLLQTRIPGVA